jgi:hypothetical protein
MVSERPADSRCIPVRATPRASRSEIAGWKEGVLHVRLAAPPSEGRANQALIELLARALHIPRNRVNIVSGATSRTKLVQVEGLGPDELRQALEGQR